MKTTIKALPKLVELGSARRQTKGTLGPNHEIDGVRPFE